MAITAVIREKADGYHYEWADIPVNPKGIQVETWEGRADTLEEAHAFLLESIRQHKPIGSLQADELVSPGKEKPAWEKD